MTDTNAPTFAAGEPIALTEGGRLLVIAVLVVLQSFHIWTPDPDQYSALLGLYATGSIVLSILARRRSTPTVKVALTTEQADKLTPPNG